MDEETFARPAAFGRPSEFARSSKKGEIMRDYKLKSWYQQQQLKEQKNIPTAFGAPREWVPGALIQTLPSVIQTGAGVPGPSRTMHPYPYRELLAQTLTSRPLLKILMGQEAFRPQKPEEPELAALAPGQEVERRRFTARDEGGEVVALDQFGGEIPKRVVKR